MAGRNVWVMVWVGGKRTLPVECTGVDEGVEVGIEG